MPQQPLDPTDTTTILTVRLPTKVAARLKAEGRRPATDPALVFAKARRMIRRRRMNWLAFSLIVPSLMICSVLALAWMQGAQVIR